VFRNRYNKFRKLAPKKELKGQKILSKMEHQRATLLRVSAKINKGYLIAENPG